MFYNYAVTVPASTSQAVPVTEILKLTKGVVHRVEVQFPIGTQALAHCQIFCHEHQLLPTNPGGSFASDGYVIPIDEHYELDAEPYQFKVKCWNDDDTYQHVITFRVGILAKEVMEPLSGIGAGLRTFLKLVGVLR